jgi:pilus assembly protein Flp/PilA
MVGQTAALRLNAAEARRFLLDVFRASSNLFLNQFFCVLSFWKGIFMLRKLFRDREGQGLVEYALLVCGIAVISLAAISLLGHKTSDLMGTAATMVPGAHVGDNGPILSGHLIETDNNGQGGSIEVSVSGPGSILSQNGTDRLGMNLFGPGSAGSANGVGGLIIESE